MTDQTDAGQFRAQLSRRGRHGLLIGVAAGLGLVVLLGLGVLLLLVFIPPTNGHGLTAGVLVPRIAQGLLLVSMGAGLGRLSADARAAYDLRDVAGSRAGATRVRRIVFKGLRPVSEEERGRAAAWAPLAAVYLRHLTGSMAILYTAITANLLLQAVTMAAGLVALHILQIVVLILLVATAAVTYALQLHRARQAANYTPAALQPTDEGTSSVGPTVERPRG